MLGTREKEEAVPSFVDYLGFGIMIQRKQLLSTVHGMAWLASFEQKKRKKP